MALTMSDKMETMLFHLRSPNESFVNLLFWASLLSPEKELPRLLLNCAAISILRAKMEKRAGSLPVPNIDFHLVFLFPIQGHTLCLVFPCSPWVKSLPRSTWPETKTSFPLLGGTWDFSLVMKIWEGDQGV